MSSDQPKDKTYMEKPSQQDIQLMLDLLPTPSNITNPYPLYDEMRELTPLYGYNDYPPGTVPGQDEAVTAWVFMKYEEVAAAARDHETFSSRDPLQDQSSAPTLMLVNHDDPEHARLRQLVNLAFSRKEIEHIKPWIAERIEEMFGALPSGEIEVIETLASVIPARVMMRLLGQPDEDADRCRGWATAFMLSADLSPEQREASNESMVHYFAEQVATLATRLQKGESPPQGLISALLLAEVDGEKLSIEEVIRFCVTLVVAGAETTTFLLANLMYNLATMPNVVSALCEDKTKITNFIEETLRHSGPPQRLFRIATKDVEIGQSKIKRGDWVALFFAAANYDPAVFPDPAKFDITRDNARRHLSMGMGIHHCLGFAVAKSEAAALVEVILARYPDISLGETQAIKQNTSLLTHSFSSLHVKFKT
ncbi:MAG: cytochrome P450 [Pseudomonadota bacterium]